MQTVFLDFETFYDIEVSVKKLTYNEYIFHPDMVFHMVSIAIDEEPPQVYCYEEIQPALDAIDWDNTLCVAHNTMFDGAILEWIYDCHPARYADTQGLSIFWWWNDQNSLARTCELCWPDDESMRKGKELVQSKGVSRLTGEVLETIKSYCIQDTFLCQQIYYLLHDIPQNEIDIIDHTLKAFFRPLMTTDPAILNRILINEITEKQELQVRTDTTLELLNSAEQFATRLRSLGIDPPMKISERTNKPTYAFSKQDLKFQALMDHPDEAVRNLIKARIRNKSNLMENRAKALLIAAEVHKGMLPAPLAYGRAVTRRFGGTQKINLLNLPKNDMRKAVKAPPGHVLITVDMSQIEVRLLAWVAREMQILEAFRQKRDVYCEFGFEVYGHTITKADELERFISKSAVLGLGYHLGAIGFSANVQRQAKNFLNREVIIPEREAKKIVNTYRSTYTKIPKLWKILQGHFKTILNNPRDKGSSFRDILYFRPHQIDLPDGCSIKYYPKQSESMHGGHMAENIMQALGRILLVDYILTIQKDIAPVAFHVYDEITCVAAESQADDVMNSMIEVMRTPLDWCEDLPLDAEGKYNYYYCK